MRNHEEKNFKRWVERWVLARWIGAEAGRDKSKQTLTRLRKLASAMLASSQAPGNDLFAPLTMCGSFQNEPPCHQQDGLSCDRAKFRLRCSMRTCGACTGCAERAPGEFCGSCADTSASTATVSVRAMSCCRSTPCALWPGPG